MGRYLKTDPAAIRFRANQYGKPELEAPDGAGMAFNLSHSADRVLYAFTKSVPVGIDIERIRHDMDPQSLIRRYFAPREAEEFFTLPEPDRREAFAAAWARKEAFLKAAGLGFSIGLDQFEVSLHPEKAARLQSVPEGLGSVRDWTLIDIPVGEDYRAALAAQAPSIRLRRFTWEDRSSK